MRRFSLGGLDLVKSLIPEKSSGKEGPAGYRRQEGCRPGGCHPVFQLDHRAAVEVGDASQQVAQARSRRLLGAWEDSKGDAQKAVESSVVCCW